MGNRVFAVSFTSVAITAIQDLFELLPATQKPIRLRALMISQSSDVGDAAEEILPITIQRGNTTSGSGGSSATPAPVSPADTAAGFTAEVNNTTQASAGTAVTLWSDMWNIRAGYQMIWPEDLAPVAVNATILAVRLPVAPADSLTVSGTVIVEELA